jgi:4-carboxymuconolactone decarboxylase
LERQSTTTLETRYEKGLAVQKSIFGDAIDRMYKESPENQLHIQKYLSANCFGDYYTRTGPQIKGHLQGNINVGNVKETLLHVITQLLPYVGYPRTLNVLRCLHEVIPE